MVHSLLFVQNHGIVAITKVVDPPLKLNSKRGLSNEFHDRAFALLSIPSVSGCCQELHLSLCMVTCIGFFSLHFCLYVNLIIYHNTLASSVDLLFIDLFFQVTVPLDKHSDYWISVSFKAFLTATGFRRIYHSFQSYEFF